MGADHPGSLQGGSDPAESRRLRRSRWSPDTLPRGERRRRTCRGLTGAALAAGDAPSAVARAGSDPPAKLRRMMLLDVSGPFRPGTGGLPPFLAGREPEQALFSSLLAVLDRGEPPPSEVVLYGPRGNGKTALLAWMEEEASTVPGVDALKITPSEFDTRTEFAEILLPESWWETARPAEFTVRGVTWRPGENAPAPRVRSVLEARSAKRPLMLLLDEAHTLDPRVGRELLNAAQSVGRTLPFLLVLAGTPNLRAHLGTTGASFWNRSRKLRIGRLEESAAAEAIRRPLESDETSISDEALAHIVRESHGYPFFLQIWGAAVWSRLNADPSVTRERVTIADTAACQSVFDSEKNDYYKDRYRELKKIRLLRPARAVAEAFETRECISDSEFDDAVRRGLGPDADDDAVEAAAEQFDHLGFVWQAGATLDWEPGIPSLMDFICREVPEV